MVGIDRQLNQHLVVDECHGAESLAVQLPQRELSAIGSQSLLGFLGIETGDPMRIEPRTGAVQRLGELAVPPSL